MVLDVLANVMLYIVKSIWEQDAVGLITAVTDVQWMHTPQEAIMDKAPPLAKVSVILHIHQYG